MNNVFKRIFINNNIVLCILFIISLFMSCTKLVEVNAPVTSVNAENVYTNDATATAVLTGIYSLMSQGTGGFTGLNGLSLRCGLSADEFTLFSNVTTPRLLAYYQNNLAAITGFGTEFWASWYTSIYYCNSALEGLARSQSISKDVKKQLNGEAKFMRAFFYYYLVNVYGDVPIVLSTDYTVNSLVSKKTKDLVLQQIIADLRDAEELLSEQFLDGSLQPYVGMSERLRPSKWAAKALLARVYLYKKDYANAEIKSSEIINEPQFSLSNLDDVFLNAGLGSREAIWQLQPVNAGWNTEEARVFVINGPRGNSRPVQLSKSLLDAFEVGDARRSNWVRDTVINGATIKYVFKYKNAKLDDPVTEYLMVFRLAEQYLIRSEARVFQGNLQGGVQDINTLRSRARAEPTVSVPDPLPALNAAVLTQPDILNKIMLERRIELFSEWGNRWFDMKRMGTIDAVMAIATPIKGGSWESFKQLYPLPSSEMERNKNMVQNNGY
jgi:hypothetical protein